MCIFLRSSFPQRFLKDLIMTARDAVQDAAATSRLRKREHEDDDDSRRKSGDGQVCAGDARKPQRSLLSSSSLVTTFSHTPYATRSPKIHPLSRSSAAASSEGVLQRNNHHSEDTSATQRLQPMPVRNFHPQYYQYDNDTFGSEFPTDCPPPSYHNLYASSSSSSLAQALTDSLPLGLSSSHVVAPGERRQHQAIAREDERLRREMEVLTQSFRELQRQYGEKCGEVIFLTKKVESLERQLSQQQRPPMNPIPRSTQPQAEVLHTDYAALTSTCGGVPYNKEPQSSTDARRPTDCVTALPPWSCGICRLTLNSETTLRMHLQGDRHRKMLSRLTGGYAAGGVVPGNTTPSALLLHASAQALYGVSDGGQTSPGEKTPSENVAAEDPLSSEPPSSSGGEPSRTHHAEANGVLSCFAPSSKSESIPKECVIPSDSSAA